MVTSEVRRLKKNQSKRVGVFLQLVLLACMVASCQGNDCSTRPVEVEDDNWRSLGFATEWILDVASDPRDPNVIFLSAVDDWFTSFGNSVIHRSFDGGYTWDTLYVPEGRRLYSLEFTDDGLGTLYAAGQTYPDPIMVSSDSGMTWQGVNTDSVEFGYCWGSLVRSHPNHSERLFVSMGYLSQNVTAWRESEDSPWQKILPGQLIEQMIFTGPQGKWITAIRLGGSRHAFSLDDGVTWEWTTNPTEPYGIYDLVFDPRDSTRLYLGTREGLQVSVDRGVTWSIVPNQPGNRYVREIEVVGNELYVAFQFSEPRFGIYDRVFRFDGVDWIQVGTQQFAENASGPQTYYELKADPHGRLFRYDAGAFIYE